MVTCSSCNIPFTNNEAKFCAICGAPAPGYSSNQNPGIPSASATKSAWPTAEEAAAAAAAPPVTPAPTPAPTPAAVSAPANSFGRRQMSEDTIYLRAISHFLKGLWLFLIATVVYQFFAGVAEGSQEEYLRCLDRSTWGIGCSDASGFLLILGFLVSVPIYFFAGKAGFQGIKILNETR